MIEWKMDDDSSDLQWSLWSDEIDLAKVRCSSVGSWVWSVRDPSAEPHTRMAYGCELDREAAVLTAETWLASHHVVQGWVRAPDGELRLWYGTELGHVCPEGLGEHVFVWWAGYDSGTTQGTVEAAMAMVEAAIKHERARNVGQE